MPLVWSERPENRPFEEELNKFAEAPGTILDMGCGSQKLAPNLIGVDAYDDGPDVNVKAYMWDTPFADESVDGILCSHALEHVSKFLVMPTLQEFERILKVGGRAIIIVPDLIWICQQFIDNPSYDWELDMLFGIQTHEGQFHKTGFTDEFMQVYLREAAPRLRVQQLHHVFAYNQRNLAFILQKW